MDGHHYPLRHFGDMVGLCEAFKALPAQVCSHLYSYESFGSWSTVVRCRGVRLRLDFDGRDREYRLQRSTSSKPPDEWQATAWCKAADPDQAIPVSDIMRAVLDCAG